MVVDIARIAPRTRPAFDAELTSRVADWLVNYRLETVIELAQAHAEGRHHTLCSVLADHRVDGGEWARAWLASFAFNGRTRVSLDMLAYGFGRVDTYWLSQRFDEVSK